MTSSGATRFASLALACFIVACSGSDISESYAFTLYRNTASVSSFRVYVATFDAYQSDAELSELVNSKNCWRAQTLFQGTKEWAGVKFWCEKGRFKK